MKVIVIGSSLSGKTTLVRYLRSNTTLPVEEIDEELTQKNDGVYPLDLKYKQKVLAPKIVKEILDRDNIFYFTNTDYFTLDNLKNARSKGFKIIQLILSLDAMKKRNKQRIENEKYEDPSQRFEGMIRYQEIIKKEGLVDRIIDASLPIEKIAGELLNCTN